MIGLSQDPDPAGGAVMAAIILGAILLAFVVGGLLLARSARRSRRESEGHDG